MNRVDLGLFDFDRHNALYFFILNADEQIYLRYGGRDSESATTYLNLRSLELALDEGLKMHTSGEVPPASRPEPVFAEDLPQLWKRTGGSGQCVECHLIADYENLRREAEGTLDRMRDMFRSPDIKTIGIHLDVPAGLVVAEANGAVAAAGLRAGDKITQLDDVRVRTFGDLQYHYDKVPRDSRRMSLGVLRGDTPQTLQVELPERWWVTDLEYRHWTVEPIVFFKTEPLSAERKAELDLPINGFAGEVTEKERFYEFAEPPLKTRDVIYGVDGVFEDDVANTPDLYIKLRHRSGSKLTLNVLRGDERFVSELTTERQNFRKAEP